MPLFPAIKWYADVLGFLLLVFEALIASLLWAGFTGSARIISIVTDAADEANVALEIFARQALAAVVGMCCDTLGVGSTSALLSSLREKVATFPENRRLC
jgi:hypothetical protein